MGGHELPTNAPSSDSRSSRSAAVTSAAASLNILRSSSSRSRSLSRSMSWRMNRPFFMSLMSSRSLLSLMSLLRAYRARFDRPVHEDEDVGDARVGGKIFERRLEGGQLVRPHIAVVLALGELDARGHHVVRIDRYEGRIAIAEDAERLSHVGRP